MPKKYKGKYLKKKCCCDISECPNCPPLASLPKLCRIRIDTPEIGEVHLYRTSAAVDEWEVLATDAEERYGFDPTHCVYIWKATFTAPECCGTCEDLPDIPFQSLDCEYHYELECPSLADPEVNITVAVTQTHTLDGVIKYGERKLVSSAQATLIHAYDCTTGKKYRWLRFSYVHAHTLTGRFIGEEVYHVEADTGQPDCVNNVIEHVVTSWNEDGVTSCKYCPFQQLIGDVIPEEDIWYHTCPIQDSGLFYHSVYGVLSDDEGMIEVDSFFEGYTTDAADTKRGAGQCFGTGQVNLECSQVEGDGPIGGSGDNTEWTYEAMELYDKWTCDEDLEHTEGCWFEQNDSYPPAVVTDIHTIPVDCSIDPGCECSTTSLADIGGETYVGIPVAFDILSGDCDHTQPNAAEPC